MKLKPLHVGISVANMEESIKWYNKILGFSLCSMKYQDKLQANVAFIKHGNFMIELFEHDNTQKLPQERFVPNEDLKIQGTKHICFRVDKIADAFAFFKKEEVDIVFGPVLMEGEYMGFIRDPSGVLIELIEPNES
ncbi:VOC family protein [Lachnospiraceae bacterium ZAX-1]